MNIGIKSLDRVELPACVVNQRGQIIRWNDRAATFFSLRTEIAIGSEWHNVVQTIQTPGCCALCRTRHSLRNGAPLYPIESNLVVAGHSRPVVVVPVPMSMSAEQAVGFLILSRGAEDGLGSAQRTTRSLHPGPRQAQSGHIIDQLTNREREILACIVDGCDARSTATQLGISHATARNYVHRVLTKLGARNKAEAVGLALTHNLLAS